MPENPNRPLMTISPDGYVPRKMKLEKVKGSSPSLREPDEVEEETSSTVSQDFLIRNTARAAIVVGVGVGSLYGSYIGEGIAQGNMNRIIFGAAGAGFSLATVAFNAKVIERLR